MVGAIVSVWSMTIHVAMYVIMAVSITDAFFSGVVPLNAPGGTNWNAPVAREGGGVRASVRLRVHDVRVCFYSRHVGTSRPFVVVRFYIQVAEMVLRALSFGRVSIA